MSDISCNDTGSLHLPHSKGCVHASSTQIPTDVSDCFFDVFSSSSIMPPVEGGMREEQSTRVNQSIQTQIQNALRASAIGLEQGISLSDQEQRFLQSMIKNSPQCFIEIDNTISNIMSDNKVNIHDIPNMILLISQIFKTYCSNVKNINMTAIIIFIVNTCIDILPILESERQLAKQIADASISLLTTNLDFISDNVSKSCCGR